MRLRVPAQDAAGVGRIIRELDPAGYVAVEAHGYGAGIFVLARHRIAVGVPAPVMQPAAPHVVAIVAGRAVPVLAIEPLGRSFNQECGLGDLAGFEIFREGNRIFEVTAPGAIHLEAVHHGPLLHAPRRCMDARHGDAGHDRVSAVSQRDAVRQASLHDERGEVVLQHRAGRILESHGENGDRRFVRHGDRERCQRLRHPRTVRNAPGCRVPGLSFTQGIPAGKFKAERQRIGKRGAAGVERGMERHLHLLAWLRAPGQCRIADRDVERGVEVLERHAIHQGAKARFL